MTNLLIPLFESLSVGTFANSHTTPPLGDAESISHIRDEVISVCSGPPDFPPITRPTSPDRRPVRIYRLRKRSELWGGKLARGLRILPDGNKVITSNLRCKLCDSRYRMYVDAAFNVQNTVPGDVNSALESFLVFPLFRWPHRICYGWIRFSKMRPYPRTCYMALV